MVNKLFPLIFGRQGGAPLKVLKNLENSKTNQFLELMLNNQKDIKLNRDNLLLSLFEAIKSENDIKIKNQLINFRRALYNNKSINKYLNLSVNEELQKSVDAYVQIIKKKDELKIIYKKIFAEDLYIAIEKLKNITNAYFFKNGLLFSSLRLSTEIQNSDFKFLNINKRSRRLILSVLKYLSRSVSKTSPFSSFNNIFCLKYEKEEYVSAKINGSTSSMQINNLFFHYLKNKLLKEKIFKNTLHVFCNASMWEESRQKPYYHFFVNRDNNEAFKKIEKTPVLLLIKNWVLSEQPCYKTLVENLVNRTKEKKEAVENFIDILIEEGFLQLNYPATSNDKDWIKKMIAFIKASHLQKITSYQELVFILDNILITTKKLEVTYHFEERKALILGLYQLLITWNEQIPFREKLQPQELFYEDTFSSENQVVKVKTLSPIINELKRVFYSFNVFSQKNKIKNTLVMYLQKYLDKRIPLLFFYEKVYLKLQQNVELEEARLKSINQVCYEIIQFIKESSKRTVEDIDLSNFTILKEKRLQESDKVAFGVYLQITDDEWNRVVINNFSNGQGANISRFLNFLPNCYAKAISQYNEQLIPDKIITEIRDASLHNVNIYPALAKYTINSHSSYSLQGQPIPIPLTNLYVSIDKERNLVLIDENGLEIQPINFSLEALNRRSKFTQFLDIFNPTDLSGYNILMHSINQFFQDKLRKEKIVCIPRITFGDRVVLQRKKWLVNKDYLSKKINTNSHGLEENYLALHKWIKNHKIPNEVFLKAGKRVFGVQQKDYHKPQYINFSLSIFILLLRNVLNSANEIIEFTEMYPSASQVEQYGGFVREYVLNIN